MKTPLSSAQRFGHQWGFCYKPCIYAVFLSCLGQRGTPCVLCPDGNNTTAVCIFLWNNTGSNGRRNLLFYICRRSEKHLLSQTQKFNKVFLRKNEKRAVFGEKNSLKTALNSVPPVRFRAVGRNRLKISFCFETF